MGTALDIVDAAFRLDRDTLGWLQGIRDAAQRALPRVKAAHVSEFEGPDGLAALRASIYETAGLGSVFAGRDATPDTERRSWCITAGELLSDAERTDLASAWKNEGVRDWLCMAATDGERGLRVLIGLGGHGLNADRRLCFERASEELRAALGVRRRMRRDALTTTQPHTDAVVPRQAREAADCDDRLRRLCERGRPMSGCRPTLSWAALMEGHFAVIGQFDREGRRTVALLPRPQGAPLRQLDEREQRVARMAGDALSNKRIALELEISEAGALRLLDTVLAKLGLSTRSELVRLRSVLSRSAA